MKSLILYWSSEKNTLRVAKVIEETLKSGGAKVDIIQMSPETIVDPLEYDLVFMGAPSYQWIPPVPVQQFVKNTMNRARGGVRPVNTPKRSGKFSVVFCTYSGVHTGLNEGVTAGGYMGQFLEHMGFFVLDKWFVPGNFQGWEEGSANGILGDIRNRPNENDLRFIKKNTESILSGLAFLL